MLKRAPATRSPGRTSWGTYSTITSRINQARRSGRLQLQKSSWSSTGWAA
ncbi:MAG: hypothetical protein JRS35_01000 [Deltaproteobacteria bacterium]|nr:hypothetical protein [Deltaproteobacteria bacterium]